MDENKKTDISNNEGLIEKIKKTLSKIIFGIFFVICIIGIGFFVIGKLKNFIKEEFPVIASVLPEVQANQDVLTSARIYPPNVNAKMHMMFNQRVKDSVIAQKVFDALQRDDLDFVDSIMTINDKNWQRKRKLILGDYADVISKKSEQKEEQTVQVYKEISDKIDFSCVSENINLPSGGVESTKRLYLNIGDKFIISNHRGGKIYATYDSGEKYEVIPGVRQKNKDTGYLTFYGGNKSSSFSVQVVERN